MTLRVGIVGFGVMGQGRAEFFRRSGALEPVGVVDPRLTGTAAGLPVHATVRELVTTARADLVDVCSPPVLHATHTLDALRAGAHVVCEKPLVVSLGEARAVAEAAAEAGRLVYPVRNYLFSRELAVLREVLRGTAFGDLVSLRFAVERPTHARGVDAWAPDWRRDPTLAGRGILLDHGSHYFYLAEELLPGPVETVSCTIADETGVHPGEECETTARVVLTAGRVDCRVDLTWNGTRRTNRYGATGTHGSVDIVDGRVEVAGPHGVHATTVASAVSRAVHESWLDALYADVRDAVARPERWPAVLRAGVSVVGLTDLAYRSAELNGTPLPVPPGGPATAIAGDPGAGYVRRPVHGE